MRAQILLHEMAHMWFGDLVTMRWWDDLWLNEAFASWAVELGRRQRTEFTDEWATFLAAGKMGGYRQDMAPATHPIRGEVPDVAQAMANFDAITYAKGASVLKQLMAYVGEDAFVEGLRAYFREHAWGNTVLDDLMSAIGEAAGRDLSGWTVAWLDRAGTDTLRLTDGAISAIVARRRRAASAPPRRRVVPRRRPTTAPTRRHAARGHRGRDHRHLDPRRPPRRPTSTCSTPATSPSPPCAPTPARSATLLDRAADLPDAVDRALAVVTGFQMVCDGELAGEDLFACVLEVLRREHSPAVVEPFLNVALELAQRWTPARPHRRAPRAARRRRGRPRRRPRPHHAGAAHPRGRGVARTSTSPASTRRPRADVDLAWRVATRRAALGQYDEATVEALLERDPDPDAAIRALAVRTARPHAEAKDEAWSELFEKKNVPGGPDARSPDPGVLAARAGRRAAPLRRPVPRRGPGAWPAAAC